VQAALDDPRPSIPHDQVMAEMRALIASKRSMIEIVSVLHSRRKYPA